MSRQDVENFAPQRIEMLRELAEKLGFTQVILFGHAQECGTVVTTWGDTAEHSAQAAAGANIIKKGWGWPEDTLVESAKVQALRDRIAELEAERPVSSFRPATVVFVIEAVEYEAGWGCRPDGYVAFPTANAAEAFIKDHDAKNNNAKIVPLDYVKFHYLGPKECSAGFFKAVVTRNLKHFNRLSEMLE